MNIAEEFIKTHTALQHRYCLIITKLSNAIYDHEFEYIDYSYLYDNAVVTDVRLSDNDSLCLYIDYDDVDLEGYLETKSGNVEFPLSFFSKEEPSYAEVLEYAKNENDKQKAKEEEKNMCADISKLKLLINKYGHDDVIEMVNCDRYN